MDKDLDKLNDAHSKALAKLDRYIKSFNNTSETLSGRINSIHDNLIHENPEVLAILHINSITWMKQLRADSSSTDHENIGSVKKFLLSLIIILDMINDLEHADIKFIKKRAESSKIDDAMKKIGEIFEQIKNKKNEEKI